jgi:hypothetical protein
MQNNLNNKSAGEGLNIVIKLTKSKDNYVYVSDSLQETSKIKIPIDIPPKKEKSLPTKKVNVIQYPPQQQMEIESEPEIEIEPEVQESLNQLEQSQKNNVIIPSCSQWFRFDDIHEIEMNSLPEFFCGKYPSKTPQNYKEYRNFMISLYRENPSCYLSSTSTSNYIYYYNLH